jgi:flagellar biosynthesis/type III secretory pathway chaperone
MNDTWEADIAGLLTELADVQTAILDVLNEKRGLLAEGDHEALSALTGREERLVERLQGCQSRRQQLLERAAADGLPSDSIQSLSRSLPDECHQRMHERIQQAQQRSRFLQHQSLTNWVLVQRTLLHLSQLIEIIATGGRMKPTYGNGSDRQSSGALVDRAV